jgi:hypothetical protein
MSRQAAANSGYETSIVAVGRLHEMSTPVAERHGRGMTGSRITCGAGGLNAPALTFNEP